MKRGDSKFLSLANIMASKWMDNRLVLLLSSAFEGMNDILSVQMRKKASKTNSLVLCPEVVNLYNSSMGGVNLIDQRTVAYRLDQKSSINFFFRNFFDLMDIAYVNSYLVYNIKHPSKLSFLDYKIVVAKNLIQYHQGWKGAVPILRPSKTKNQPDSIHNHGGHLPYYQTMRKQSTHSAMGGKEKRTFIICLAFKILLCLVKERNCLQKYHI